MTNLYSVLESRDITLPTRIHCCGFSSSHVQMWKLSHKEDWALKNWCFWIVVLGKILESPLLYKKIQTVSLKGTQPWIFIGRTVAEAPILWSHDAKELMLGKIEGKRRRRQRLRWLNSSTDSTDVNLSKLWKTVKDREAWHAAVHGIARSWTWLSV